MMFKRAKRIFSLGLVLLLTLLCSVAFAEEGISWEEGTVTVYGTGVVPPNAVHPAQGRMLARRAAIVDGYRQLAEMVKGVNVDSQTTVENMITTSDIIRTNVSAVIKGALVVSEEATEDGGYIVVMQLPMYGGGNCLAGAIMPRGSKQAFPVPSALHAPTPPAALSVNNIVPPPAVPQYAPQPAAPQYAPQPAAPQYAPQPAAPQYAPQPVAPQYAPQPAAPQYAPQPAAPQYAPQPVPSSAAPAPAGQAAGGYTGLVIDCSEMGLKPAMSPVIYNDEGTPIYGYKNLDSATVINRGMAGYARSVEEASRAGAHPLVVSAVSINGANPVIATADANRILIENGATHFLDQAAVVFIR